MAISVDDSTAARWTGTINRSQAIKSASFTPANNSLLVVCVNWDEYNTSSTHTVSGGSLTWTQRVERNYDDSGSHAGGAAIWTAPVSTGASMTVTVTRAANGDEDNRRYSAKCYIVTGHAASPIGANNEGSTTANSFNATLTATGAGRVFSAMTDWNALGGAPTNGLSPTYPATVEGAYYSGSITAGSAYASSDHSSGTVGCTFDQYGTGSGDVNWVALEILTDGGGATWPHPTRVLSGPFVGPFRGCLQ